jgi:NAD(P)-dependent dehydrogenase (short-subunit alcohol dehydrogenase family)
MTPYPDLPGRFALVTGGTSGIGAACVERLSREGVTIAFTGGDERRGEALAGETGATFIPCDSADRAQSDQAVKQALSLGGNRLDVLVTNSDLQTQASIEVTSPAEFGRLIEVNLTAVFRTARVCFAAMRSSGGGTMIHVASDAGIRAAHEAPAYSVASAGVLAMAELLAAEGAPERIRANAVCPGHIPPGTEGVTVAGDVASLVAWLASDEAAHVSGATLRADGGAGAAMLVDTRV